MRAPPPHLLWEARQSLFCSPALDSLLLRPPVLRSLCGYLYVPVTAQGSAVSRPAGGAHQERKSLGQKIHLKFCCCLYSWVDVGFNLTDIY